METAGLWLGGKPNRPADALYLGSYELPSGQHAMMNFAGEGYLITVAPTGAGKTSGHVLPAATFYRGPIVFFDPKGEVYEDSKWVRRRRGNVIKWAPYATDYEGDGFNPLDFVRSYDDAASLAHMLIPSPPSGVDPFWVDATRELVAGGLWFEILTQPPGEATIAGVYRRLNDLRRTIPNQFDGNGQPIFNDALEEVPRGAHPDGRSQSRRPRREPGGHGGQRETADELLGSHAGEHGDLGAPGDREGFLEDPARVQPAQEFVGKQIIKLAGFNPVKSHFAMMHKFPLYTDSVARNRDDNEKVDIPEYE